MVSQPATRLLSTFCSGRNNISTMPAAVKRTLTAALIRLSSILSARMPSDACYPPDDLSNTNHPPITHNQLCISLPKPTLATTEAISLHQMRRQRKQEQAMNSSHRPGKTAMRYLTKIRSFCAITFTKPGSLCAPPSHIFLSDALETIHTLSSLVATDADDTFVTADELIHVSNLPLLASEAFREELYVRGYLERPNQDNRLLCQPWCIVRPRLLQVFHNRRPKQVAAVPVSSRSPQHPSPQAIGRRGGLTVAEALKVGIHLLSANIEGDPCTSTPTRPSPSNQSICWSCKSPQTAPDSSTSPFVQESPLSTTQSCDFCESSYVSSHTTPPSSPELVVLNCKEKSVLGTISETALRSLAPRVALMKAKRSCMDVDARSFQRLCLNDDFCSFLTLLEDATLLDVPHTEGPRLAGNPSQRLGASEVFSRVPDIIQESTPFTSTPTSTRLPLALAFAARRSTPWIKCQTQGFSVTFVGHDSALILASVFQILKVELWGCKEPLEVKNSEGGVVSMTTNSLEAGVTVGTPTQCDGLTVSWTGGQAPFEILLTPSLSTLQNISVPASAFSNGKGSYSISPLTLAAGTLFLLTMSDATGFGSGGTTNQLTVGNPVANNNCDTEVLSPPYTFNLSPLQILQCSQFTISYTGAILPATIVQLIPGGQSVVFNSVNSNTFTSVADVNVGTNLIFFMTDSAGRQGGVSGFEQVLSSSNTSCLNANSPSSTSSMSATATATTSTSTSASSTSNPSSSTSSNVAVIAGAAVGGAAALAALVLLGMFLSRRKRRASRSPSPDIISSPKSRPHQLQRTDPDYEVNPHGDIAPQFPFPYKTNPINYHTQPIQRSLRTQSDMTSSSAGTFAVSAPPTPFSHTQHSRQSSNTDFPIYGDTRSSTTMSSAYNRIAAMTQPTSQTYPLPYPISYLSPPIQPGSQSPPPNASTGNFTTSDHPTLFNQSLHSRQSSNTDFAVYGDARSPAMSSVDRRMAAVAETTLLPSPWQTDPISYSGPPIQPGPQSPPPNASAGNFAARDVPAPFNQTQPSESHKSFSTDFGDARSSDMSSVDKDMSAGARPASPLPRKTDLIYLAPPIQHGSQSISAQAPAGHVTVNDPSTLFNQTQKSRQSPNTDSLAVYGASGSQSMAATTAVGQTDYQTPARILVHTDAEDVVPDNNGVVELPPQYSDYRGVRAS
ncbi:hypothetical protein DEU56DRAFT_903368 [Suillus clintonianus]|uniref:uncharacterized protein n=1 Tax=Suillus clintonianus TaxID=1904413 RepID=UPI001B872AB8|nr:uncharacterized protein DEU56DRAFT_903368 [Suillus clintonianus]KAG2126828.1 hypothetical protein DEU56DRAFT_903368 [Suillus clintonianus]